MAHYILNLAGAGARDEAARFLRTGRWPVEAGERHRDALRAGDLVLVYLAAPERMFVGRAELASAADSGEVSLARVEEWDPPVPMSAVLARIESPQAKADFDAGVVEITSAEYEAALAVAAERAN